MFTTPASLSHGFLDIDYEVMLILVSFSSAEFTVGCFLVKPSTC